MDSTGRPTPAEFLLAMDDVEIDDVSDLWLFRRLLLCLGSLNISDHAENGKQKKKERGETVNHGESADVGDVKRKIQCPNKEGFRSRCPQNY